MKRLMNLLAELQQKDTKGYFTRTEQLISYPTMFHTLDYRNGYMLKAYDDNDNLIKEQASVGIVGGTFNTSIGKPGAGKTAAFIQMGMNIVLPYEHSFVIHCDAEGAITESRVKAITGVSNSVLNQKYVLKQDTVFIEDIFDFILKIAQMKLAGGDKFKHDTGYLNIYGQPIRSYQPTVVIIDSIPSLELRDNDNLDESTIDKIMGGKSKKEQVNEMAGDTNVTRKAKKLAQFYRHLGPVIKKANIIIMAINHINEKIEINPFAKTQAQTMYLKMNESLPGGNAPIYYANNIFKFTTSEKYKMEDDGFDGFLSKCEMIKSRTNKAGQVVPLVYNQELGFDPVLSLLHYAEKEAGVVEGRNPYRYFKGYDDIKFDARKFRDLFYTNEALQNALFDSTIPKLEQLLSRGLESEVVHDQFDIMGRVYKSLAA